ncbi:MAG: 23S rRNA (pseudouridine(1915)-N(3))-methyltransferase RlmH [Alphaproteobacteria bacterium]|nr:23S rRNA (pseudouridine(1915)-N(3))-methyltransferase RlmH [Alphaproteobacteria bacterium]
MQMKVTLIVSGKMKSGPELDLYINYIERLPYSVSLIEIDVKGSDETQKNLSENKRFMEELSRINGYVIALDEKGKSLTSRQIAEKFNNITLLGHDHIIFLIGGSSGLSEEVKQQCDLLISFGKMTWPHKLVRVMLAEQLYRIYSINVNHPYHKD